MNCRSLEKWIWQEGAGNLPAGAIDHAAQCPDCRTMIEQVRLLDRSVGASVTPNPDEVYWDAMAQRIASRLDHPTDRVIEFVPAVPAWRRFVGRVWAPTMAVALLAVIASQKTTTLSTPDSIDLARLPENTAALAPTEESTTRDSDQSLKAIVRENPQSESGTPNIQLKPNAEQSATMAVRPRSEAVETEHAHLDVPAPTQPSQTSTAPAGVRSDAVVSESTDQVWPERQVMIMGQVDSNSPDAPLADDNRLAGQDPFGAYERQVADAEQGVESVGTFASPGRLLDGPTVSASRGSERLTPAEQMRRFDEIAELHDLIAALESVPESSRAMSQWTQWSTAWYRLGMLSHESVVLDSAITAVGYFQTLVPLDSASRAEWLTRRSHLQNRRENLEY